MGKRKFNYYHKCNIIVYRRLWFKGRRRMEEMALIDRMQMEEWWQNNYNIIFLYILEVLEVLNYWNL